MTLLNKLYLIWLVTWVGVIFNVNCLAKTSKVSPPVRGEKINKSLINAKKKKAMDRTQPFLVEIKKRIQAFTQTANLADPERGPVVVIVPENNLPPEFSTLINAIPKLFITENKIQTAKFEWAWEGDIEKEVMTPEPELILKAEFVANKKWVLVAAKPVGPQVFAIPKDDKKWLWTVNLDEYATEDGAKDHLQKFELVPGKTVHLAEGLSIELRGYGHKIDMERRDLAFLELEAKLGEKVQYVRFFQSNQGGKENLFNKWTLEFLQCDDQGPPHDEHAKSYFNLLRVK